MSAGPISSFLMGPHIVLMTRERAGERKRDLHGTSAVGESSWKARASRCLERGGRALSEFGGAGTRSESLLEAVDNARSGSGRVGGQAHLVPLAPDGAVGLERSQELGEDLLLRMARAAPELLPGDSPAQRILAVEDLEERQGLGAETIARLAVHVPLAIDGRHGLRLLELVEQRAEALGAEGGAGAQVRGAEPRPGRAGAPTTWAGGAVGRRKWSASATPFA